MRDNPFYSPRLLIADARDDIYSLNETVRDFVKHQKTLISYFDLEQRLYVHTVQFGKPLSPKLPVLMRKAVGSLRSALDQAVYASAITLGSRGRLVSTWNSSGDQLTKSDYWNECKVRLDGAFVVKRGQVVPGDYSGTCQYYEQTAVRSISGDRGLLAALGTRREAVLRGQPLAVLQGRRYKLP